MQLLWANNCIYYINCLNPRKWWIWRKSKMCLNISDSPTATRRQECLRERWFRRRMTCREWNLNHAVLLSRFTTDVAKIFFHTWAKARRRPGSDPTDISWHLGSMCYNISTVEYFHSPPTHAPCDYVMCAELRVSFFFE